MVGSNYIELRSLTLEELSGVVNLYPWYGAARMELCRRMSALGADGWGETQFASEAIFLADRSKISALIRRSRQTDCSDKDVATLLGSMIEDPHPVHVVGGDYFSQAQYDGVRQREDNVFSRFIKKAKEEGSSPQENGSDIAGVFATETLARIFAEQGRPEEAKRIYSRLILDIPEKSAYFASLIDNLE